MKQFSTVRAVALAAVAAVLIAGCGGGFSGNSYLNSEPPELGTSGTWLNAETPLSLASLRGDVVWLEFSFFN